MSFKDAPVGARFYYPGMDDKVIWVKLSSHDDLIVKWSGNKQGYQEYCSFTDSKDDITLKTLVELI